MEKIRLVGFLLFVLPQLCFATLINVNITFMEDEMPHFDRINLLVDADYSGSSPRWLSALSGSLETKGEVYTLGPSIGLHLFERGGVREWLVANIATHFVDSNSISHYLELHLESIPSSFYIGGVGVDPWDSYMFLDGKPQSQHASFSVSVPEPASILLLMLGFVALAWKRLSKSQSKASFEKMS